MADEQENGVRLMPRLIAALFLVLLVGQGAPSRVPLAPQDDDRQSPASPTRDATVSEPDSQLSADADLPPI